MAETDTKIIDLDALVPELRQVKLGGVVYKLPGDMPLEIFLRINKAAQQSEDDDSDETKILAAMEIMVNALVDLFSWENKEVDRAAVETTVKRRGLKSVMTMLQDIYNDPEPEAETDPTTPTEDGSTPPSTTSGEASGETSSDASRTEPTTAAVAS